MCGRFVRQKEVDDIVRDFSIQQVACDLRPSYNVAPTQQIAVIIEDGVKQLVTPSFPRCPLFIPGSHIGQMACFNCRAYPTVSAGPSSSIPVFTIEFRIVPVGRA